jgi:threonine aldolase
MLRPRARVRQTNSPVAAGAFAGAFDRVLATPMEKGRARFDFASDNTAGFCPETLRALEAANSGAVASYGEDELTRTLSDRVRQVFETDCEVFLVFNGTAANSLALAQLCQSFHGIVCHRDAHIQTDECGAPEFFTGGAKLILAGGDHGRIDPAEFEKIIGRFRDLHSHKPRVVSLTQATEYGTVYQPAQIRALSEAAHHFEMLVYLDGARFANAVASLGVSPADATWRAGVDAMSFGGIKNGGGNAELVIFFRKEIAREFEYRLKQAGQLASKTRFLAATWLALLDDDLWLRNARKANSAARQLSEELRRITHEPAAFPVEANAVFVSLSADVYDRIVRAGWRFYNFFDPGLYRLMCSWATDDALIREFTRDWEAAIRS